MLAAAARAGARPEDLSGLLGPDGNINADAMGPHAQALLKTLDDLAETDPDAYKAYVRSVIDDFVAEERASSTGKRLLSVARVCCIRTFIQNTRSARASSKSEDSARPPRPGHIVRRTLPSEAASGQVLYINLVSHERCGCPTLDGPTSSGRPEDGEPLCEHLRKSAEPGAPLAVPSSSTQSETATRIRRLPLPSLLSLRMPLLMGEPFSVKGTARTEWALDVCVHSCFRYLTARDDFAPYLTQFLASEVEDELGITLRKAVPHNEQFPVDTKVWNDAYVRACSYSATKSHKEEPQKFDVTPFLAPSATTGASAAKPASSMASSVTASPGQLLARLREEAARESSESSTITASAAPRQTKRPLISEIPEPSAAAASSSTAAPSAAPVHGFENLGVSIADGVMTVKLRPIAPLRPADVRMSMLDLFIDKDGLRLGVNDSGRSAWEEDTTSPTWPSRAPLHVPFGRIVCVDAAAAKYVRASHTLTVTAPLE